MTYLGLDPGQSGGIAVLAADGTVLQAIKMPATERDLLDTLAPYAGARAVLEKVHAMPAQGVASVFTFGKGYGGLRMALVASNVIFDEVTPQRWQAALGCRSGGDKNVTKRRAQELFPGLSITHALADAILLSEYCRRFHLVLLSKLAVLAVNG